MNENCRICRKKKNSWLYDVKCKDNHNYHWSCLMREADLRNYSDCTYCQNEFSKIHIKCCKKCFCRVDLDSSDVCYTYSQLCLACYELIAEREHIQRCYKCKHLLETKGKKCN